MILSVLFYVVNKSKDGPSHYKNKVITFVEHPKIYDVGSSGEQIKIDVTSEGNPDNTITEVNPETLKENYSNIERMVWNHKKTFHQLEERVLARGVGVEDLMLSVDLIPDDRSDEERYPLLFFFSFSKSKEPDGVLNRKGCKIFPYCNVHLFSLIFL